MVRFFIKNMPGFDLTEGKAIRLIHDKLEEAYAKCEAGEEYMRHLVKAHSMLEDFFEIKEIDDSAYDEMEETYEDRPKMSMLPSPTK